MLWRITTHSRGVVMLCFNFITLTLELTSNTYFDKCPQCSEC
uniref:Uncharacterized protein n=2 Tax=Anguilla anguilla TaxID=7936 RepID=A0A0E9QHJ3_ANGAN